nr:hypothetical protein [Tanacetum cinerariifolium]
MELATTVFMEMESRLHEPSYNQNYNDNYYPHESPSFPCCDNCGESHATFQCQPNDQNVDFSNSDQIQTPQYPEIHPPSNEISDEVFHAKGDIMKSIQIFLEEFNCIPFEEKPTILLQAWFKFFTIKHDQPEDSNELFQKLFEDLKELAEYKESLENSSNEIDASNSNQEKEGPPQDSDIRQLNREECCVEICEEQKQNMEDTILELVEICRQKELFFAPILSTKEPEYSPSMGYENPNTTLETESDEIIKSESVSIEEENVVYQEEEEVDLEDVFQIQDVVLREKLLSITRLIANIESLNDNPTPDHVLNSSVSIAIFEESDNSLSDNFSPEFETFCDHTKETRSGITTTHADNSFPEYDSFCFEIEPDQERLINVVKNDISDDSTSDPLLEEADLFLASDNSIPPGIENFANNSEEDIRFLEELLIDDSIPFPVNESSESDFDNLSFPRPPPEPLDANFDFELGAGNEILVVMNTIVKLECLDPRVEFDVSNDENDDYSSFMFVICSMMFLSFLSAKSEDTIFDPGISV